MFNRYYEDELNKLKGLAVEFSRANPALAPMLSGASADPDVERLLEGVAFLTGLTRQKLDDEFPEFVQELANLLFPHYLRPIPASTLVSFAPKGLLAESVSVAAGSKIDSVPVDGTPCRFRTCTELVVHPLSLSAARLVSGAGQAPRLVLAFDIQGGLDLTQWTVPAIRLFLGGGYTEASKLLLLLANHVKTASVKSDGVASDLGPKAIRHSGFESELLPYPSHAFQGYRALQEFFVLPEKLLFVDIEGLDKALAKGTGTSFEVSLLLDHLPDWMPDIRADSFMLNIVPAVNLFEHAADPVNHEHRASEYRLMPEAANRQHYQIYSVDQVVGYQQGASRERAYVPFGMLQHDGSNTLSYRTTLRSATVGRGSDVFLSVAYPPGDVPLPETLSVQITCTNRQLPESLKLGDLSKPTSSSPDRMTFRNIRPMTSPLNPPSGEALLWRLVSHVSLNFLSIANAENLRALLGLYVFSERQEQGQETANRRRIDSIQQVTATRETRLVGRGSLLRGQQIRIKCRLDFFASIGDMYVFGCVLDRFLGDYAGINSYTRVELEDAFTGAVF
ncbi:MAG: type VI secretion system baseplate subunit TssF, partial [Polaromonas sp.]|nr:type VI secretion system baseplate subunit TssF [Polaromonas sp.]